MKRNPSQPSAFTLVELLVVIGIIALLISILLPALNRARAQANTVKCLAGLRTIGQSIMLYANAHKGTLPYGYWDGAGTAPDGVKAASTGNSSDWATLVLYTMVGAKASGGVTYTDALIANGGNNQRIFTCPAALDNYGADKRVLHFGGHPRIMPDLDQREPSIPGATSPLMRPYRISQIKQSSDIALAWDATQNMQTDGNSFAVCNGIDEDSFFRGDSTAGHTRNFFLKGYTPAGEEINLDQAVFAYNKDRANNNGPYNAYTFADIRWRHGKGDAANFIFADGHADTRRLKPGKDAEFKLRNLHVNKNF
jgi:prepilin-type N-terminal cleavage/methylation domain-containing protein/prepilin-type processing-associated H-X9-DG protein